MKEMEESGERWDLGGWEGATAMIDCRESAGVRRGVRGRRRWPHVWLPIGTIDGIMGLGLD